MLVTLIVWLLQQNQRFYAGDKKRQGKNQFGFCSHLMQTKRPHKEQISKAAGAASNTGMEGDKIVLIPFNPVFKGAGRRSTTSCIHSRL